MSDFDIAVIGSGFAGSLMAMIASRLGRSVVLLEKGSHPRFAIGESSTPLTNLLLEELASKYELPDLLPLTKWGPWQKAYPSAGCGLKRGFSFYHHNLDRPSAGHFDRKDQLLVAASPRDEIADTHWYRPDFDQLMMTKACSAGVQYFDLFEITACATSDQGVTISGSHKGSPVSLGARFVIDASGPRGCLYRLLQLSEAAFPHLPPTQALFCHFRDVERLEGSTRDEQSSYPNSVPRPNNAAEAITTVPPYPVDDAALHHVFDGGWIWILRFNNGITSAGVAAVDFLAHEVRLSEGRAAWKRLLRRLPVVEKQFVRAVPVVPFQTIDRLSFQAGQIIGRRWALLPSAAGFVDPLLSTGFPLALLGVARLAELIGNDWESRNFPNALERYADQTKRELSATERLVAALYATMRDFPLFSALSRLYFAAASYSEAARRLDRSELAKGFLLCDHAEFSREFQTCCSLAFQPGALSPSDRTGLLARIESAIEPFDVLGLCDSQRRNWFPARAEDLLKAAPKLGVTINEVQKLLIRSGFCQATSL